MFRIKICGITNCQDAQDAAEVGASAIGLNFYRKSPRYVTPDTAAAISRILPKDVAKVGVFVNMAPTEMVAVADQAQLDFLQLHGDEAPDVLAKISTYPIVRAFRHGELSIQEMITYLDACKQLGASPDAVLVDACSPGDYGGSGKTGNWGMIRSINSSLEGKPLVLAGGLRPANVVEALRQARPMAVDVASGVESSPGHKSRELMRQFVERALEFWSDER